MKNAQYMILGALFVLLNSHPAISSEGVANTDIAPAAATRSGASTGEINRHGQPDKTHVQYASRSGRSLHVQATAYALYGRTSTGSITEHGSIAVDPRVIPYGSRIYVPGYGWGKAVDCGGAIQGQIIDLWMPSNGQCYDWGRRSVDIIVQPPDSRK